MIQVRKMRSEFLGSWPSSRHIYIIQRLLKLKVESVGFVQAVPERTTKTVDC